MYSKIDNYNEQFEDIIKDIKSHKALINNTGIQINTSSLKNNYEMVTNKTNNFIQQIEMNTDESLETYEKNYLLIYNILKNNDIKEKNSKFKSDEELEKRKAFYTSQELSKRNRNAYILQIIYFFIFLVFTIECLRSKKIGIFSKLTLIILFALIPYLTYNVFIPWFYKYQINSDKYNVIKDVYIE